MFFDATSACERTGSGETPAAMIRSSFSSTRERSAASIDEAPQFMRDDFAATCRGNKYTTTLHVLNSLVVKCSKLTTATKVYRGSAKGVLPDSFWNPNAHGVRGGVEAAFMSTTTDSSVAVGYASRKSLSGREATPMLFEMQQGMVDRGAELGWISQVGGVTACSVG